MTPTNPSSDNPAGDRTYTMERVFNAPRDLVWKAFTEPERIAQWWGPRGFTTTVKEMNVTPGGTWLYGMSNPEFMNGQPSWGKTVYSDIVAPEKLVYTDYFTDEDGNVQPNMPSIVTTVLFDDLGGKTKITSHALFATTEDLEKVIAMGMEQGATETWDRLEEYLA